MKAEKKLPDDEYISEVLTRLKRSKRIHRIIPGGGRLHIDRPLPFLAIYREPKTADPGTGKLLLPGSSFAITKKGLSSSRAFRKLICALSDSLIQKFNSFLLVEIWASKKKDANIDNFAPSFRVFITEQKYSELESTIESLLKSLLNITINKQSPNVTLNITKSPTPPGMMNILNSKDLNNANLHSIGIEIDPIYSKNKNLYPVIRKELGIHLNYALQNTYFHFSRSLTTLEASHAYSMGRKSPLSAVWNADDEFEKLCSKFDFIRMATPINEAEARLEFQKCKYEKEPVFYYQPLSFDPAEMKKSLWNIPLNRIEDSALGKLFFDKRDELDLQLTMLSNLDSPAFRYGSLQLYGDVDELTYKTSLKLLNTLPLRRNKKNSDEPVDSKKFLSFAKNEISFYSRKNKYFKLKAELTDEMFSGMMVSRDTLFIGTEFKVPYSRVNALIQHEIGTHLITYFNGLSQPFQLLHNGLSGYEELQEGLAVMAEYLVGGLSTTRLRMLAARVITAKNMLDNATFTEAFRILVHKYKFTKFNAFTIVMRIYRGGGLTKDIIYLRGFLHLIKYLQTGGELEPLFTGKISSAHLPVIKELSIRNILKPVPLLPRYLSNPESQNRLNLLRKNFSLIKYASKI